MTLPLFIFHLNFNSFNSILKVVLPNIAQNTNTYILPSLFQRTQACPLLSFGVKAFDRVKQLPI